MIDPQVAFDKLAQFDTVYDLCNFFQDEGIKGVVQNASKCPIATWMQEATGAGMVTVAGKIKVWAKSSENPCGSMEFHDMIFEHTEATSQFILKFDTHQIPWLEKQEND